MEHVCPGSSKRHRGRPPKECTCPWPLGSALLVCSGRCVSDDSELIATRHVYVGADVRPGAQVGLNYECSKCGARRRWGVVDSNAYRANVRARR